MKFEQAIKAYNERRRAADIELLWPVCYDYYSDLEAARDAFEIHVRMNDAWTELSGAEIHTIVSGLVAPRQ